MNHINSTDKITLITLASALFGFISFYFNPLFATLYLIIFTLPIITTIEPQIGIVKLATFTITTFIFGLINGNLVAQLQNYFSGDDPELPTFSIYLSLMTVYHYFEFQMVNNFHHQELHWRSFLIYHSLPYALANCFSLGEHFIGKYYFGLNFKIYHPLMIPSLVIGIVGESLRIIAFFTCKSNFTHIVQHYKRSQHTLITHGIYSFFRHPAYTGYFYFSTFLQLFLGNFISFLAFFVVLSRFFNKRIYQQEQSLADFFPEYLNYKKITYILIPFVRDPKLREEEIQEQKFKEPQETQNCN